MTGWTLFFTVLGISTPAYWFVFKLIPWIEGESK